MATPAGAAAARSRRDVGEPDRAAGRHADGQLHGRRRRLLPRRARRPAAARRSTASPKYTIDVIDDRPPTVTFEKPKRDTNGESGRRSVRAGARRRRLRRAAARPRLLGQRRRRRRRSRSTARARSRWTKSVAGHTVYLEELGVKPGDFVSYYAKAPDTDTVKGPKITSSDIYFIRDPAVQPELQAGAVAGRRGRRWRGRRRTAAAGRALASSSGRSSRRRSTSSATSRR